MRKLCWGCAAVGLAALGLWQAAGFACRHPDTIVARCLVGAYQASVYFSPIYHAGAFLVDRAADARDIDPADAIDIPDDPEPVLVGDPGPLEPQQAAELGGEFGLNRGRLPGKIVIEEGEEPPMALPEGRIPPEPNPEQFVERIEVQWTSDAAGSGAEIATAFWQTPDVGARQMPYCLDEDDLSTHAMPYADESDAAPRKRPEPRIWNPFPPRSTEVGGHEESGLSPHGNDCREDPAASQQIPGCLNLRLKCPATEKATPGGEEQSEPPPEKKKSKRAEPPKAKRTLDESKLTPWAAPVKLDTMEFRPSDWGKNDVPLPPF